MSRAGAILLVAMLLAIPASSQTGTRITVINNDGLGEGFNDPTPKAPVGGNPGTTLGEQRLIAFQFAADLWAALLDSPIEIKVEANFDPLECTATSAVLGAAGPDSVYANFRNAPIPGVWYVGPLASKLAGEDLDEGDPAIGARFNSALNGNPNCAGGSSWYYGLDNRPGSNQTDLVVVVLHELAHGLGFLTPTNKTTGAFLGNRADIYANFLFDNTLGLRWTQMTNAQRATSAKNTGNLVWIGQNAVSAAPSFLAPASVFLITSPESLSGVYLFDRASFGGEITIGGVTATIVAAEDEANTAGPTTTDGCTTILNASAVAGKIALIDRGDCTFVTKVKNAQNAGALAAIIANNVDGPPQPMGGDDDSITIPAIGISQSDGAAIRAQLASGVEASIRLDPSRLAGTDELGRPRMYAPDPVEEGSSVSHWDTTAEPDLLMEPSINDSLGHGVDLSRDLFADLGWFSNATVESTLRDFLLIDVDRDGEVDPGDTVRLVATIQNNGDIAGQSVVFDLAIPAGVTVVPGSVTGVTVVEAGDRLTVELGTLTVGGEKTITFDIRIDPALPPTTTSISLQGAISGANLDSSVTDDPSTAEADDPTIVIISHTPLRAFKAVDLLMDSDSSGDLSSGDVLRYHVLITNHSASSVADVLFEDRVDINTILVPGSVNATGGTVIEGNQHGDRVVRVNLGTLPPGGVVEISYDVTVNAGIPAETRSIVNQGTIMGAGIEIVRTDDPATHTLFDPTAIHFFDPRKRSVRRP